MAGVQLADCSRRRQFPVLSDVCSGYLPDRLHRSWACLFGHMPAARVLFPFFRVSKHRGYRHRQRGWVDEPSKTLAADISVEGNIWFSPSAHENFFVKMIWDLFAKNGLPFPSAKANAIKVNLYNAENPIKQALPVRVGKSNRFKNPAFARHKDHAFAVSNVEVKIGPIQKVGHEVVDDFNQLVMDAFNLASGNLLQPGNILTWNVWVTGPQLVDQQEWRDHAERWRKSIDTGHVTPDGPGKPPKYFDGRPFSPINSIIQEEIDKIIAFLKKHLLNL